MTTRHGRRAVPRRTAPLIAAALLLGACASAPTTPGGQSAVGAVPRAAPVPHPPIGSGYTPHRIWDTAAAAFIDLETLAARAATADVVLFGERHGHRPTHRMQLALLEAMTRRTQATLALEMFERDVAHIVDRYTAGAASYDEFVAGARAWPSHATDYHPLIEHARAHGWRVVAANAPRDIAMRVAQEGLAALGSLGAQARAHVAAELHCPDDDYRTRFLAEMTRHATAEGHGHLHTGEDVLQRYYEAQCLKDETMAESIVQALREARRPVVHMTGAFHTDFGDGVPVRVRRREPDAMMLTVSSVAVEDLDEVDTAAHGGRADYLLFTLQRPVQQPAPPPAR
jgi:uncharacterized iron-regulated protein